MNFRINTQFAAIAILFSISSLMGDDTKPAAPAPAAPAAAIPDIAPFLLPSVEEKFASEAARADAATAKAEAEASKAKKAAAEIRLKAYKDKLAEITKTGDFDKAQQIKARITQLENDPEGESQKPEKPTKRPRPKDTVKFGGHTYALIKEPVTWHTAKLKCEEMGGHLVVIDNSAEATFIVRLAHDNAVWIGASDDGEVGKWTWIDGKPVDLTGWTLEKSDFSQGAVYWPTTKTFNDQVMGAHQLFICEWEK